MDIEEIYQDLIVDHYRHPRCQIVLPDPKLQASVKNPLCGDSLEFALKLFKQQVEAASFHGRGCAISQACASMLTSWSVGKDLQALAVQRDLFEQQLIRELSSAELKQLGDFAAFSGLRNFPARQRCARLAWEALGICLEKSVAK